THGRLRDLLRLGATDVHDDQAEGAPDSRVGAKSVPERVVAAIHADLLANRTVDNRQRCRGEGRDVKSMSVEFLITQGLDRGQHYRKVRRMAPGHDLVNGDLLNRGATVVRTDRADHFL